MVCGVLFFKRLSKMLLPSTGFKEAGAGRQEAVIPGARAAAPIHFAADA